MTFAYLSQGKLRLKPADSEARLIHSKFGQQVIDRSLDVAQKRAWKAESNRGPFGGTVLWGGQGAGAQVEVVNFTGAALGPGGQLYYLIQTSGLCGLFRLDLANDEERRLFTDNNRRASDLALSPDGSELAMSVAFPHGIAGLAVVQADGAGLQLVTEGDSRDEAPAWVPGEGRRLVFQSAGVARTPGGVAAGLGPASIEQLDLDTGTMETLRVEKDFDLLTPRVGADGALYFIRRPYEAPGARRFKLGTFLLDIVAFPFRLLRALLGFLNVFSMMFTQKPLTMAGGPERREQDAMPLFLRGRKIEAEKSLRELRGSDPEHAGLVPSDWQLVRRTERGEEKILARQVLAFDLLPDGRLAYTNGRAIFVAAADGAHAKIVARDRVVETVSAG
ncbi:MAG: hypothetical protein JSR82_14775 [Verrucomicrobia bacterium]|nr:hypothetical protein [Verrucomicrobiota bacterium]